MEFQDDVEDELWEAQKSVFSSLKRSLATAINFTQILPDLLRLKFFTKEQLVRHNQFEGASSDVIVRALEERVNTERPVFPLLLVTLRRINSELVDEIHHGVSSQMNRNNMTSESFRESTVDDVIFLQNNFSLLNKAMGVRSDHRYHPFPSSPYSRRPFTIHPLHDQRNLDDIRRQDVTSSSSGAYYSKASLKNIHSSDVSQMQSGDDENTNLLSKQNQVKSKNKETSKSSFLKETVVFSHPNSEEFSHHNSNELPQPLGGAIPQSPSGALPHPSGKALPFTPCEAFTNSTKRESFHPAKEQLQTSEKTNGHKLISEKRNNHFPFDKWSQEKLEPKSTEHEASNGNQMQSFDFKSAQTEMLATSCLHDLNTELCDTKNMNYPKVAYPRPVCFAAPTSTASPKVPEPGVNSGPSIQTLGGSISSLVLTDMPSRDHALLQLIKQKFSRHHHDVMNKKVHAKLDLRHIDVIDLTKELVARCVISVRSAWLIRRCTKPSECFRKYLELLASLKSHDIDDLMRFCFKNKTFVEKILATMPQTVQIFSECTGNDEALKPQSSMFDSAARCSDEDRPNDFFTN